MDIIEKNRWDSILGTETLQELHDVVDTLFPLMIQGRKKAYGKQPMLNFISTLIHNEKVWTKDYELHEFRVLTRNYSIRQQAFYLYNK
jgi:hypothetical protein